MHFDTAANEFALQWTNPLFVLPLLLIFGGDIIGLTFAQLVGRNVTPVTFSMGWVAYTLSALVSIGTEKRLMPEPDTSCVVLNGANGRETKNSSWVLGRLVRDFETWMDPVAANRLFEIREQNKRTVSHLRAASKLAHDMDVMDQLAVGLCVSVYEPKFTYTAGVPRGPDLSYFLSIIVLLFQIAIAAIPLTLFGDWGVMVITFSGILLTYVVAALPCWRKEKWDCRRQSHKTVVLTRGLQSQHAILILGNGHGLDIEDLARARGKSVHSNVLLTKIVLIGVAISSLALLITASGKRSNIWYQVGILVIGTAQNLFVVTRPRPPSAFGIHLRFAEVIAESEVMSTLLRIEERFPGVGRSMLQAYFPGKLSEKESIQWAEMEGKSAKITLRRKREEEEIWNKLARQGQESQV